MLPKQEAGILCEFGGRPGGPLNTIMQRGFGEKARLGLPRLSTFWASHTTVRFTCCEPATKTSQSDHLCVCIHFGFALDRGAPPHCAHANRLTTTTAADAPLQGQLLKIPQHVIVRFQPLAEYPNYPLWLRFHTHASGCLNGEICFAAPVRHNYGNARNCKFYAFAHAKTHNRARDLIYAWKSGTIVRKLGSGVPAPGRVRIGARHNRDDGELLRANVLR